MIKKKVLSQIDKEVWDNFIKSPSHIYDKEQENKKYKFTKKKLKYDLHGFTLENANKKVKEIILSSAGAGCNELLLITGKGLHSTTDADVYVSKDLSKLKSSVPEFIRNDDEINKYVISISEASIEDGGAGAILIKLKNL